LLVAQVAAWADLTVAVLAAVVVVQVALELLRLLASEHLLQSQLAVVVQVVLLDQIVGLTASIQYFQL
jgi:hypothetical protein